MDDNLEATILAAVNTINSTNLTTTDVEVINITTATATVNAKTTSDLYTGQVSVAFTITPEPPTPVELSTVATDLDLGEIADNTPSTIMTAFLAQNNSVDSNEVEVTGTPTSTSAVISAKSGSTVYIGNVSVTYTLPALRAGNAPKASKSKVKTDNSNDELVYDKIGK